MDKTVPFDGPLEPHPEAQNMWWSSTETPFLASSGSIPLLQQGDIRNESGRTEMLDMAWQDPTWLESLPIDLSNFDGDGLFGRSFGQTELN